MSLYLGNLYVFKSKVDTVRDTDSYETRDREDCRTGRYRVAASERFPSQVGVTFVDKLPNSVKSVTLSKALESRLKSAQIMEAVYNKDELMGHDFGFTHGANRLDEIGMNKK